MAISARISCSAWPAISTVPRASSMRCCRNWSTSREAASTLPKPSAISAKSFMRRSIFSRPSPSEHGVIIEASVDTAIELPLERARMERVFLNLISSNAIEAMPAGGRISILAAQNGNGTLVDVSDTGPGIPDAVRAHLFQPFVTSGKNGLGLGLALSRQTLLDHGGDLWVENNATGGARFRLRLPA